VNDSFQNWRGMEESGIRQVKRSIFIDIRSIRFIDKEMKERLCRVPSLKKYIESFDQKTDFSETDINDSLSPFFNFSQITNLGIFRFYAESFLKLNPDIDKEQTIIMRHRPLEGNGLPLQLFLFTKNNQFAPYENIQSEIIEHLLAIMSEFGLKAFQQPTGEDLHILSKKMN
jgi:miniconductance mechanosensitive channel